MSNVASRWLLFGLLIGWSLSHATVFAQPTKSGPADKVRQGLDKVITVDYTGQSLSDAINHMREKTGLRINIDQLTIMQMGMNPDDNIGQVTIKGTNEKAGQIFRRLLSAHNLTYVVFEDALLVTTEEMAIHRLFRQRVSIDVEDVPFRKAVRDLARSHGINLVLDPKLGPSADAKVSLQLDDTDLETTIRLLAEIADVKAVAMGNVIFVTTASKAKQIRDEDRQQLDPLNPNMPRVFPAPGIRAVGGFGGGMPFRVAVPPLAVPPLGVPEAAPAIDLPAKEAPRNAPPQRPDAAPGAQPGAPPQVDPPVIRRVPSEVPQPR